MTRHSCIVRLLLWVLLTFGLFFPAEAQADGDASLSQNCDLVVEVLGCLDLVETPKQGIPVYLFSESGLYQGIHSVSDSEGRVHWTLPCHEMYKARADYRSRSFWSNPFMGVDATVRIPESRATVKVAKADNTPVSAVPVYLFNESGVYLSVRQTTNMDGETEFILADGIYAFRADVQAGRFFADNVAIPTAAAVAIDTGMRPIEVLLDSPVFGVNVYAFTESGSYIGLHGQTDAGGRTELDLVNGRCKFRADFQGKQYWSQVIDSPQTQSATIELNMTSVAVQAARHDGTAISGVNVYAFSPAGNYLGLSATTETSGFAAFELASGEVKFRADYQGGRFWSDTVDVVVASQVPIQTHEAPFEVRLSASLADIPVYVFSASGRYLGFNDRTNAAGSVVFGLANGDFLFRADYQGEQFWSDPVTLNAPPDRPTSAAIDLGVSMVSASVIGEDGNPVEGAVVYAFTDPEEIYLGENGSTGPDGHVAFELATGEYRFRADYQLKRYWSEPFSAPRVQSVVINTHVRDFSVNLSSAIQGVPIYAFTGDGRYMGVSGQSDADGRVVFALAEGSLRFRADYQGSQFWSDIYDPTIIDSGTIDLGGGPIAVKVRDAQWQGVAGVNVYVFSAAGTYLSISGQTDTNGEVFFELSDGSYKFRADIQGNRFWSDTIVSPTSGPVYCDTGKRPISVHLDAAITGVPIYAFSAAGIYVGIHAISDESGGVRLDLVDGDWKFRADYLVGQFWSEAISSPAETAATIPLGVETVTLKVVKQNGEGISGVGVYGFKNPSTYVSIKNDTSGDGLVSFSLATGEYRFRADLLGYQYWSDVVILPQAVPEHTIETFMHPVTVSLAPMAAGKHIYLFKTPNTYVGVHRESDAAGRAVFEIPAGTFKLRADVDGQQYWSEEFDGASVENVTIQAGVASCTEDADCDPESEICEDFACISWICTQNENCAIDETCYRHRCAGPGSIAGTLFANTDPAISFPRVELFDQPYESHSEPLAETTPTPTGVPGEYAFIFESLPAGEYWILANGESSAKLTKFYGYDPNAPIALTGTQSLGTRIYLDVEDTRLGKILGEITVPVGHLDDQIVAAAGFYSDLEQFLPSVYGSITAIDESGEISDILSYEILNLPAQSYFAGSGIFVQGCPDNGPTAIATYGPDGPPAEIVIDPEQGLRVISGLNVDFTGMDLTCEPTGCTVDDDCPENQVCRSSECIEVECIESSDCPPGETCIGNYCVGAGNVGTLIAHPDIDPATIQVAFALQRYQDHPDEDDGYLVDILPTSQPNEYTFLPPSDLPDGVYWVAAGGVFNSGGTGPHFGFDPDAPIAVAGGEMERPLLLFLGIEDFRLGKISASIRVPDGSEMAGNVGCVLWYFSDFTYGEFKPPADPVNTARYDINSVSNLFRCEFINLPTDAYYFIGGLRRRTSSGEWELNMGVNGYDGDLIVDPQNGPRERSLYFQLWNQDFYPESAVCDDRVTCTEDRLMDNLLCENVPNDLLCDDGDPDTIDICDPITGCPTKETRWSVGMPSSIDPAFITPMYTYNEDAALAANGENFFSLFIGALMNNSHHDVYYHVIEIEADGSPAYVSGEKAKMLPLSYGSDSSEPAAAAFGTDYLAVWTTDCFQKLYAARVHGAPGSGYNVYEQDRDGVLLYEVPETLTVDETCTVEYYSECGEDGDGDGECEVNSECIDTGQQTYEVLCNIHYPNVVYLPEKEAFVIAWPEVCDSNNEDEITNACEIGNNGDWLDKWKTLKAITITKDDLDNGVQPLVSDPTVIVERNGCLDVEGEIPKYVSEFAKPGLAVSKPIGDEAGEEVVFITWKGGNDSDLARAQKLSYNTCFQYQWDSPPRKPRNPYGIAYSAYGGLYVLDEEFELTALPQSDEETERTSFIWDETYQGESFPDDACTDTCQPTHGDEWDEPCLLPNDEDSDWHAAHANPAAFKLHDQSYCASASYPSVASSGDGTFLVAYNTVHNYGKDGDSYHFLYARPVSLTLDASTSNVHVNLGKLARLDAKRSSKRDGPHPNIVGYKTDAGEHLYLATWLETNYATREVESDNFLKCMPHCKDGYQRIAGNVIRVGYPDDTSDGDYDSDSDYDSGSSRHNPVIQVRDSSSGAFLDTVEDNTFTVAVNNRYNDILSPNSNLYYSKTRTDGVTHGGYSNVQALAVNEGTFLAIWPDMLGVDNDISGKVVQVEADGSLSVEVPQKRISASQTVNVGLYPIVTQNGPFPLISWAAQEKHGMAIKYARLHQDGTMSAPMGEKLTRLESEYSMYGRAQALGSTTMLLLWSDAHTDEEDWTGDIDGEFVLLASLLDSDGNPLSGLSITNNEADYILEWDDPSAFVVARSHEGIGPDEHGGSSGYAYKSEHTVQRPVVIHLGADRYLAFWRRTHMDISMPNTFLYSYHAVLLTYDSGNRAVTIDHSTLFSTADPYNGWTNWAHLSGWGDSALSFNEDNNLFVVAQNTVLYGGYLLGNLSVGELFVISDNSDSENPSLFQANKASPSITRLQDGENSANLIVWHTTNYPAGDPCATNNQPQNFLCDFDIHGAILPVSGSNDPRDGDVECNEFKLFPTDTEPIRRMYPLLAILNGSPVLFWMETPLEEPGGEPVNRYIATLKGATLDCDLNSNPVTNCLNPGACAVNKNQFVITSNAAFEWHTRNPTYSVTANDGDSLILAYTEYDDGVPRVKTRKIENIPAEAPCTYDMQCADAYGCTGDTCVNGVCVNQILKTRCLIDGQCYAAEEGLGSDCLECNPNRDPYGWSLRCTWNEVCNNNACEPVASSTDDLPCSCETTFLNPREGVVPESTPEASAFYSCVPFYWYETSTCPQDSEPSD